MNYSPLVYARDCTNVAVSGEGTLDGQAGPEHWWPWKGSADFGWRQGQPNYNAARRRLLDMAERGVPVRERVFGEGDYLRPSFIQPYRCTNVLIDGVTIVNSPMWEIHPVLCRNVTVRGVTIDSHGPNNDGCDPESCADVLIEQCVFDTGDDCIAIKSGRNADGRRVNAPSENIVIRNCEMRDGHGGVTVGSEISGGCWNVFAHDCRMNSPRLDFALRLKNNAMRGGLLHDIYMRDVTIGQIVTAVLSIDFTYEEGAAGSFTPIARDVELPACDEPQERVRRRLAGTAQRTRRTCARARLPVRRRGEGEFDRARAGDRVARNDDKRSAGPVIGASARWAAIALAAAGAMGAPATFNTPWSVRVAQTAMRRSPGAILDQWDYTAGLMLLALERVGATTHDPAYAAYVKRSVDSLLRADGTIVGYNVSEHNLDQINEGRALFSLLDRTHDARYARAALELREQLRDQPRTPEGGFWHKQIYPDQMWLDGLYMAEPFYAEYALRHGDTAAFTDVAHQFLLAAQHLRDPKTGLFYHAWDSAHSQPWADSATGTSKMFWGRADGWYLMAALDVLDYLPATHPDRERTRAGRPRSRRRRWLACRTRRPACGGRCSTNRIATATISRRRPRQCSPTRSPKVRASACSTRRTARWPIVRSRECSMSS